jgi:DNA-binding PadR family transcriptional regulator
LFEDPFDILKDGKSEASDHVTRNLWRFPFSIALLSLFVSAPLSGYRIKTILMARFGIKSSYGSIYPIIHSLEERGLIERVIKNQLREKKEYMITKLGLSIIEESIKQYQFLVEQLKAASVKSAFWESRGMLKNGIEQVAQIV